MSIFGRSDDSQAAPSETDTYATRELTESDVEALADAENHPRTAILARPHRDNGGIEACHDVLESLYSPQTTTAGVLHGGGENVSPAHSFEIRYARESTTSQNRVLTLQYVPGEGYDNALERRLQNHYTDSRMERRPAAFLGATPGQHVSGATFALRHYTLFPLKNVELGEWRSDPTGSILTEMVGTQEDDEADADVVVQVMFRPAPRNWLDGVENGHGVGERSDGGWFDVDGSPSVRKITHNLRQPTYETRGLLPFPLSLYWYETLEHKPPKKATDVATMLEEQDGKAWELCVRVFAVSDDPDVAKDRAASTAQMYRNFYEFRSEQSFVPLPLSGDDLTDQLARGARRTFDETGIVQTQKATAGVVNIPKADDVSTNKLRWALAKPGEGVPPGTPRFNFDAAGVPGDASDGRKQLAMLDAGRTVDTVEEREDVPYYYGVGSKHGVEAGVFPINLDAHQFVNGATRKGKTTWLTNFASQVYRRDEGALIVDPKGKDADEFIAEWPEDRDEDDLIVIDLGDEFDKIPQFNFLEVPDGIEPGTRAHVSYVEALADDLTAMVADAGGSDKYLGALMKRVTKTLTRGLARSEVPCTLLDLALAGSSQENLGTFREWMDDERIEFIRDTAERLAEKEDTDLEPLAGRFDEWIHNDAIRDLISAREPTFSIQDAVEQGKVIVVRFPTAAGDTEKRLFTTALIRRTYCAQRSADTGRPFHLICDEFDSVVSSSSSVHQILSEAGAFKYRCTLACQAPSNQLPERVKHAVENQCESFVSFNPGGTKEAAFIAGQHSSDIGKDDLTALPKYKFYFRTHDDDDNLTQSFMVDSFPPVREVRADLDDVAVRTDEEIRELKLRSLDRYGGRTESAQEQRERSRFHSGEIPDVDADGHSGSENGLSSDAGAEATVDPVAAVAKAAYDEALREHGDVSEWVDSDAVRERFDRYVGNVTLSEYGAALRDADVVEYQDTVDGERVRFAGDSKEAFLPNGTNVTEGGPAHGQLLRDAYDGLTVLGLEVDVREQSGGSDVDGVGRLRESFSPEADPATSPRAFAAAVDAFEDAHPTLAELTGVRDVTVEAESSTGKGKPAATLRNVAKAVEQDRRALLLCRPETAPHVERTLTDPPLVADVDAEGNRRFYNRKRLLVDDAYALRPANAERTVWREDDDEILLTDNEGVEHARYADYRDIFTDSTPLPALSSDEDVDEDSIGRGKQWRNVSRPFIPEQEFSREVTPDDYRIVTVDRDGVLALYEDGETTPLTAETDRDDATTSVETPDGEDDPIHVESKADAEGDSGSAWSRFDEVFTDGGET